MPPKKFPLKKTLIAAAVAAAVILLIWKYGFKSQPTPNLATVTRGEVIQKVSVTGNVEPAESVDLAFEKSGEISGVYADVGDKVYASETLVRLDTSELSTELAKAKADLAAQQSSLDESRIVLTNYYSGVIDVLNGAYTAANDAVRKQANDMFTNDKYNPRLMFVSISSQDESSAESQILVTNKELSDLLNEINILNQLSSTDVLDKGLADARTKLTDIRNFLDLLNKIVADSAANIPQSTIDTFKSDLTTARTNIDTASANVNTQQQNIIAQKAAISSNEANVNSYEASIENIQAQLNKASLEAPISGVVTRQDAKVGEIAAAGTTLVSIITGSDLEVEAFIPEADIAKVKIGDSAEITLDAYGNDVLFDAKVISIDPGETMTEGVATYKTKFQFTKNDGRPKSGMTANIDITTDKRENVLILPQRAVSANTNGKFVSVWKGQSPPEEREVKTGLRGSDGNVEIVDGLSEGEKVIIPTVE